MNWFEVLKAARRLSKRGKEITAAALAEEAGIQRGEKSTETQIASAWLGKFAKWGYVKRVETPQDKLGGRPVTFYEMTANGLDKKPKFKMPAYTGRNRRRPQGEELGETEET